MLLEGTPDGELAPTLAQVRQGLAAGPGAGGRTSPALQMMVDDFGLPPRGDRRARRVWASFGALSVTLPLFAILLVVANVTVAADPAPALLALFDGGL